ncbi:MAG: hypothetical protein J5449_10775 [Oscillospiraceae bacterium]|nr:hypothetical protein [Oscillospiraceae bacterium]
MSEMHKSTEILASSDGAAAYRICLLLTGRTYKAEQAVFQAFLYLAERKDDLSPEAARRELYRYVLRTADDALYRKDVAPIRKATFEMLSGLTVSDGLWRLMKLPFKRRAAVGLMLVARFSPADAAAVLRIKPERAEQWLAAVDDAEALRAELDAIEPQAPWADQLGGKLLMHWQEHNVPLKNKLHRLRSAADHLAPYFALAVVLFCIIAIWYTSKLNAALVG